MNKFYITSAIPYVNAKPHIGHALEFVQTDVIARFQRILGKEVWKLCGGDENALKNVQAAEKARLPIQEFIDKNNELFVELTHKLNADYDVWQKGSDKNHHFIASQELWKRCEKNGDIYKKAYTGLYCVGCELFYEKDELNENGECYEHPGKKLEEVTEENYFFKLSKYQKEITEIIQNNIIEIAPEKRKHEVLAFLRKGLQDISISRSNVRAKNWGVPVPGDDSQRMYVWFDALNIYQSGVGFGWDEILYKKWWPADIQVIGKGIIRFHAIYWPAFLMSAKLSLPKKLFVHEYFTVNGQKMSKTLGNVVDPIEMIEKYGTDALRLYFLKHFSPFSDGDFSEENLKEVYNADLANGLGNLVARVARLAENSGFEFSETKGLQDVYKEKWVDAMFTYDFNSALQRIWVDVSAVDKHVNQNAPWLVKDEEKLKIILQEEIDDIRKIALRLKPFIPETAEKIWDQFKQTSITAGNALFPRIK